MLFTQVDMRQASRSIASHVWAMSVHPVFHRRWWIWWQFFLQHCQGWSLSRFEFERWRCLRYRERYHLAAAFRDPLRQVYTILEHLIGIFPERAQALHIAQAG
jgi:hypothetical protein